MTESCCTFKAYSAMFGLKVVGTFACASWMVNTRPNIGGIKTTITMMVDVTSCVARQCWIFVNSSHLCNNNYLCTSFPIVASSGIEKIIVNWIYKKSLFEIYFSNIHHHLACALIKHYLQHYSWSWAFVVRLPINMMCKVGHNKSIGPFFMSKWSMLAPCAPLTIHSNLMVVKSIVLNSNSFVKWQIMNDIVDILHYHQNNYPFFINIMSGQWCNSKIKGTFNNKNGLNR